MHPSNLPNHTPRAAHCIGCGKTFHKMHWMFHHRRLDRCGGRFLPSDERELRMAARDHWQSYNNVRLSDLELARWHFHQNRDMLYRANTLRQRRLRP